MTNNPFLKDLNTKQLLAVARKVDVAKALTGNRQDLAENLQDLVLCLIELVEKRELALSLLDPEWEATAQTQPHGKTEFSPDFEKRLLAALDVREGLPKVGPGSQLVFEEILIKRATELLELSRKKPVVCIVASCVEQELARDLETKIKDRYTVLHVLTEEESIGRERIPNNGNPARAFEAFDAVRKCDELIMLCGIYEGVWKAAIAGYALGQGKIVWMHGQPWPESESARAWDRAPNIFANLPKFPIGGEL